MAVIGDRVLRCSDGHLFVSHESSRLFKSIHLGAKRYMQCPVDLRWRMCENIRLDNLSPDQLAEAQRYKT